MCCVCEDAIGLFPVLPTPAFLACSHAYGEIAGGSQAMRMCDCVFAIVYSLHSPASKRRGLETSMQLTAPYIFRYGDFTTQSDTGEGLWFANGTLQASKVKLLSRTYAQVTINYNCSVAPSSTLDLLQLLSLLNSINLHVWERNSPWTFWLLLSRL